MFSLSHSLSLSLSLSLAGHNTQYPDMVRREHPRSRLCDLLQEGESVSASDGSSCSGFPCFRIPEMGSVVASITGYAGDERSNLIHLINSSGACYVGKLLKGSITHLVCWAFDGPKYEMAKRFGIRIINHRWLEDCFKAGKRLDESPYTVCSGKEVGAVLWKADNYEGSSSHHAKLELELSSKHAHIKEYQPDSARADGCEMLPYYAHALSLRSQRTSAEDEIQDISDDGHELEVLLQKKPARRDKGKRKDLLVLKNRSLTHQNVSKNKRKVIASATHAEQRKYVDTKNRVTHSILEYVHPIDDIEARKVHRLVRKTEIMKAHNSFDNLEVANMANPHEDNNNATPRREANEYHPDSLGSLSYNDAASFKNLSEYPVVCTLVPADIECVICHTDHITSAEGVLACGHHFCFQCIRKWALEASRTPTCPLCKASFDMITKREQIPGLSDKEVVYEEAVVMVGGIDKGNYEQLEESTGILTCIMCGIGDMEEVLLTCTGCRARSAHSFCLDPPLPPSSNTSWCCGRCSQRRRADTTWWHQLHLLDS